ncbi:hypothetical protein MTF65_05285 [Streptomyces sp. APSN-46.1]|uniref:hypothetical protein n=1 Tax=Streptomyces sp. APSN-46.1 TaxID=2929049 RepID=UPI001FB1CDF7|nr:hypothetical protein [Streptomyces sp. APSN-46.1]MCJ1676769.1 hypothetical protein [Streptomyces sp. APSN-46.1]
MIESVPSLAVTLAQIRALATERQLDMDEILDARDLAASTGVPVQQTAALLRGEESDAPTPASDAAAEAIARRRAAFLCVNSRDADGRPYRPEHIAEAIGATAQSVADLISGRAGNQPSPTHRIAAFFGRDGSFLTDTPSQALSRALQPTLRSLRHVSGGDPLAGLVSRYGLVSLSTRSATPGKTLSRTQETLILGMITGILSSEGAA